MSAGGSSIRLQLLAPARVKHGEPVPFTLHIVNAGDRRATLYLQGRPPAFDLLVQDDAGRMIWRRLAGATRLMVLGVRELGPGDALDFGDVWPQQDEAGRPVAPARYHLTAIVPGEPGRELRSEEVILDILRS
jgi:Intracellular proteinase inhibitor